MCKLLSVKEDVELGFLRELDLEEIKKNLNMVERDAKRYNCSDEPVNSTQHAAKK